ncbi:DUF3570 domain-containing protein [Aliikangiella maris]|uniref:DUF3570 domain-containing protein n=2 Tax=Aliikangiella maris TaxID=3162458 RepID=A0ABV2BQ95_9GAMM
MQLKNKNTRLVEKLAVATATLLGTSAGAQNAEEDWQFVGTMLAYSEPDRVSALEMILTAEKSYDDTAKLAYKVVFDSLTGASANGAIEQDQVQTFTRPSGNGQYSISALDTPLDDTFKDTRVQFNVSWSDTFSQDYLYTVGTNISKEYDYISLAVNGEIARNFNQKNTTLSAGLSFASDSIEPEGGRPLAFSSMVIDQGQFADDASYRAAFDTTRIDGDGSVDTAELLFGWTQVIDRHSIMQLNVGYADMSGYLTDPFKVLSSIDSNAQAQDYRYENRPDSRSQFSLFGLYKYHLDESVIDISYRMVDDDWDIQSHTLDFKWHLFAGENTFWEPRIRYYQQSAANFYMPYLVEGEALPEYASADYRLADMTALTLGLKYGFMIGENRTEVRLEYYRQTPDGNGAEKVAAASQYDLYPEVDAYILQATYYF